MLKFWQIKTRTGGEFDSAELYLGVVMPDTRNRFPHSIRWQVMQVKSIVERCEVDLSGVDDHGKAAAHIAACHDHCHEASMHLYDNA